MIKPNKKVLLAVFLGALFLRLGVLVGFDSAFSRYEQADSKAYGVVALNLMKGNGFIDGSGEPTNMRPPVYPLFLAAVHTVAGPGDLAVRALQCLADSFSVVLLMLIAGLVFNPAIALLSGVLAAVYPPFLLYANLKLTECLFIFMVLLETYLLTRSFKERDNGKFAYAGLVHGIGVLLRSSTLLLPAFLLPAVLFTGLRKSLLKGFAAYLLISSALISVWTVRNYRVFHEFLPVNTGGGWLLWDAVQDDVWDGDVMVELDPLREYPELKGLPRPEMENIVGRRVVARAIRHPLWYSGKMLRNFLHLWYLPVGKVMLAGVSRTAAAAYQAAHYLLLATALLGLFCLSKRNVFAALPSLVNLLYVSVMHSMVLGIPRYRLPFDPFLLMFFACGLFLLYGRLAGKSAAPCAD